MQPFPILTSTCLHFGHSKGMQFVPEGLWLYAKEPHLLFRTWGSPAVQSNPNAL